MIRNAEEFGKAIRRARKALGFTQGELAARCGVGINFVVDLETGKETCQIGKALTVAVELGFSFADRPGAAAGATPEPVRDMDDDLAHLPKF